MAILALDKIQKLDKGKLKNSELSGALSSRHSLVYILASSFLAAVIPGFAKLQAQHGPKLWNPSDHRTEEVFIAAGYYSGTTIVAPVAVHSLDLLP